MPMINPRIKAREVASAEGYEQEAYIPPVAVAGLPMVVPRKWIQVSDEFILDSILTDGQPKVFRNVLTVNITDKGQVYPVSWDKYVRKVGNGYNVAAYDDHRDKWHLWHFKDINDLCMNPMSIIGNAMFAFPQSRLFFDPENGNVNFPIPGLNAPLEKVKPPPPLVFPPIEIPPQYRVGEVIRIEKGKKSKNPRYGYEKPKQIKGRVEVLRNRRLSQYGGLVNLAWLGNNEKGKYAVWADDMGSLVDTKSLKHKIYGDPAIYGIRYYQHQGDALNDYWHRRYAGEPIPLKGD
jgi:hypothetical protein